MTQIQIKGKVLDTNISTYKYLCVGLTNGNAVAFRMMNGGVVSFNPSTNKIGKTHYILLKDCAEVFLSRKCTVFVTNEISDIEEFLSKNIII